MAVAPVHDPKTALRVIQGLLIAMVALSLPTAAVAVFSFDTDRGVTADVVTVLFLLGLIALLLTPWLPFSYQRSESRFTRLQSMVFIWFGVTYTIHLTWELIWLLFHNVIARSPDSVWAYPWWAYIDGGDRRYASSDATLLTQEVLAVTAGVLGYAALFIWRRSRGRSTTATLMFMCLASAELLSTAIYFGSELFDGYPNVDTSSIADFWIKFWLLNGLWLVWPWFVLYWGNRTLRRQYEVAS